LLLSVLLCLPFQSFTKNKRKAIPFLFIHLLKAKKQSKDVVFYLIGVHPDYQNKAVTAVIFSEYYHTFKRGVENCFRTPELADNTQFIIYGNISIQKLIAEENFQDRALTKCSVLVLSNIFCLK
jgi:hypothetical protein